MTEPTAFHGAPTGGNGGPLTAAIVLVVAVAFIGLAIAKPWASGAPPTPSAAVVATEGSATPTSSSGSASPTSSPTPTLDASAPFSLQAPPDATSTWTGLRWTELKPDDPLRLVSTVVRWRRGYVAVGWDARSGVVSTPVWTSTDGVEWQSLSGPGVSAFWPGLSVIALASVPNGLVALTRLGDPSYCTGGAGCLPMMAWTSPDARTWEPHDGPALGEPDGAGPPLVATGPAGVLALSTYQPPKAAISRGGISWRRLQDAAMPRGLRAGALVATGTGYILGGSMSAGGTRVSATAWSANGRSWTAARALPSAGQSSASSYVTDLFTGSRGVIALANVGDTPGPELWWQSQDGRRWRTLPDNSPLSPANVRIVADGNRIVALRGGQYRGAWTSNDGLAWQPLALDGDLPPDLDHYAVILPGGILLTDGTTSWYGAASAG